MGGQCYQSGQAMSPNNKSTWRKLHLSMIDEAELMNARDLGKLISTLKG
jgi:hypothetical protein